MHYLLLPLQKNFKKSISFQNANFVAQTVKELPKIGLVKRTRASPNILNPQTVARNRKKKKKSEKRFILSCAVYIPLFKMTEKKIDDWRVMQKIVDKEKFLLKIRY